MFIAFRFTSLINFYALNFRVKLFKRIRQWWESRSLKTSKTGLNISCYHHCDQCIPSSLLAQINTDPYETCNGNLLLQIVIYFFGFRSCNVATRSNVARPTSRRHPRNPAAGVNRAQHITSVKVFFALVLLLIASYIPTILFFQGIVSHYWNHLYFINHIGNPIVYYVINKTFRKDVNLLFKSLVK